MENVSEYTLEELVQAYQNASDELESLTAAMKVVKDEMQSRLQEKNVKGMVVGDYSVTLVERVTASGVKIDTARQLGATKMKEVVDQPKIKKLMKAGVEVEGVRVTSYIMIKQNEPAE